MKNLSNRIRDLIVQQFHQRILEESIPRILQCIDELSEEEIWKRPNISSNSIANLILHLIGNARQYILSGIAGETDVRVRNIEFSITSGRTKTSLKKDLNNLSEELRSTMDRIEAADLVIVKDVQCYRMSVTAIIIHVIEHFSYHTGQIVYYTKALKNKDLEFYKGLDLDKKAGD